MKPRAARVRARFRKSAPYESHAAAPMKQNDGRVTRAATRVRHVDGNGSPAAFVMDSLELQRRGGGRHDRYRQRDDQRSQD